MALLVGARLFSCCVWRRAARGQRDAPSLTSGNATVLGHVHLVLHQRAAKPWNEQTHGKAELHGAPMGAVAVPLACAL